MTANHISRDEPDPYRAGTPEEFGQELTLLRERAGLTVRQVASGAGIPVSTAGDYFAGRHLPLPSQAETLRRLVRFCGAKSEDVEDWTQALARARRGPGRRRANSIPPYKGLAPFEVTDAEWFFGREELIDLLVTVASHTSSGNLVAVTGASGSGKSSLLRAGLLAQLTARPDNGDADVWHVELLTPGSTPIDALAARLEAVTNRKQAEIGVWLRDPRARIGELPAALRGGGIDLASSPPAATRLAVIVDQFEELFIACEDESERRDFVGALADLANLALVVLGLRADFYGQALRYPELAEALQHRQVVVGPMTQPELQRAIIEPARRAKLTLEPGLADLLLSDLARPGSIGIQLAAWPDAGALPLLSHALRATWERSRGGRLSVADYQATGGIWDAVTRTAEAVYAALDGNDRQIAGQLFLSLVHVSEDGPLARARVPIVDLVGVNDVDGLAEGRNADSGPWAGVLARFVDERLVTVDEQAAQLTHEALLTAWPRLKDWIRSGRDGLKVRHRIASAAAAWQEAGRDEAVLLRGAPLMTAVEWAADQTNRASLRPLVREFLDESVSHERAQRLMERRRVSRLRQLTAVMATLALLAVTLTAYAFAQRHAVTLARDQADSREVAVEAEQVRSEDPALAAQLSLAAYQISPTQTALASLLESAAFPIASRFRDTTSLVQSVALAPDNRTLAVAGADGTLRLWSVTKSRQLVALGKSLLHLSSPLYAAAFSPNSNLLAAAGAGAIIWLFNVADPRHVTELRTPLRGLRSTIYSLTFSADGKILAAGSADKTVQLWDFADTAHPRSIGRPLTGATDAIQSVAISPNGQFLAAGSRDRTVRLWNIAHPARPKKLGRPLTGPTDAVNAVSFSPNGQILAVGSRDDSVWTWNVTKPDHPVRALAPLTNATDWINALAFSPNGRVLAAGSSDDTVRLWNASTGQLLATLPGPQPITTLVWNKNNTVIAGEADGMVRAWAIPTPVLLNSGAINQVAYSPNGRLLGIAGTNLQLWNTNTRAPVATATVTNASVGSVAWAPGGKLLAAAYQDGKVRMWRTADGHLARVGPALTASTHFIAEYVAFRADGKVLVSTGEDGTVRLWDIADPARPRRLAVLRIPGTIAFSAAFSPNGRTLAAASSDDLIRLWNVTDPAKPRLSARPLAGPATYAISVAFSPNGRVLAAGSADKTTRLWSVVNPKHPTELGGPLTGPGGYIYSVAFNPDGTTLAVGSTDGTIWLWDVADPASPSLITDLTSALAPTGRIYSVAFSPAGDRLASASSDGSVRLWDLRPSRAVATLCATVGQPITQSEWASYIPGRPYDPPCPKN